MSQSDFSPQRLPDSDNLPDQEKLMAFKRMLQEVQKKLNSLEILPFLNQLNVELLRKQLSEIAQEFRSLRKEPATNEIFQLADTVNLNLSDAINKLNLALYIINKHTFSEKLEIQQEFYYSFKDCQDSLDEAINSITLIYKLRTPQDSSKIETQIEASSLIGKYYSDIVEVRSSILHSRALLSEMRDLFISKGIIYQEQADQITSSIRQMEGPIHKLSSLLDLFRSVPNVQKVRIELEDVENLVIELTQQLLNFLSNAPLSIWTDQQERKQQLIQAKLDDLLDKSQTLLQDISLLINQLGSQK